MSKHWIPVVLLMSLALVGADARADVSSTFTTGLEGWTGTGGAVSHVSTGGNPGGYLLETDQSGSPVAGMLVNAPAAFLGDLSTYDDGSMSFDTNQTVTAGGAGGVLTGQVTIRSNALSATYDFIASNHTQSSWGSYSTSLDEGTWGVTAATWSSILGNVTAIEVVLEAESGVVEQVGFDNFGLKARFIPEPSSILLLGLGGLGLAGAAIRRRKARKKA